MGSWKANVKLRNQACPYRFTSCAFVLSPFNESPRHRSQNLSSSFFSEEGFLPAKEAPGMSSSVRVTAFEMSGLVEAIFCCDL